MSTQAFSFLETTPFPTTKDTKEHQGEFKSLLDEPWKVTLAPEPPRLPPGVLPAPDPHAVKSLPWRRGDVARLKDDSPRGMMEYIAAHTNGWWQELAERALRDTDKAERMAREQGWQPGQYWSLEVDAEAKRKLLDAEEAKRQREEAERATEAAAKEAFMQRQMELLKKAGRAPRCEYLYTDGRGCRAPQVKGERWCHGHAKAMSYRPEKLEMELMEDEPAVMVNLYRVTRSLLAGKISEKTAGLMLWSVAIGMPGARRAKKTYHGGTETRRKSKNYLPQNNTDERRSEKRQIEKARPKTFATQRNGGSRGAKKVSRELTRNELTRKKTNECDAHSGVTRRKSFKSGVDRGSTPVIAEIARDRTTSPRSEERNHKGHKGAGSKEGRVIAEGKQFSVSPCPGPPMRPVLPQRGGCLRGEKSSSSHKDHESSSSIRVDPRQSAVGGCSSSVSLCLRGENNLRTTKPTEDGEEQRGGGAESPGPA